MTCLCIDHKHELARIIKRLQGICTRKGSYAVLLPYSVKAACVLADNNDHGIAVLLVIVLEYNNVNGLVHVAKAANKGKAEARCGVLGMRCGRVLRCDSLAVCIYKDEV